jgi:hypothetical protein
MTTIANRSRTRLNQDAMDSPYADPVTVRYDNGIERMSNVIRDVRVLLRCRNVRNAPSRRRPPTTSVTDFGSLRSPPPTITKATSRANPMNAVAEALERGRDIDPPSDRVDLRPESKRSVMCARVPKPGAATEYEARS